MVGLLEPGVGLLARAEERACLDQILAATRQRLSGVLVLLGEPGMGKTALLNYVEAAAKTDMQIARLEGIESEMELGYAALHQLIRPSLGHIDVLPRPQANALRLALGLEEGGHPDPFLVGLATLGLLAHRAAERPLLCVVDDAHWLDRESANVLAFVARRLDADAIGMVFAVRDPAPSDRVFEGLPELRLEGLGEPEAGELLALVTGARLGRSVRERIVDDTRGNPLALIEIGQGLAPEQLSGDAPLPDPLPIGRQLELRYLQEVQALPSDTQTFLLAAAADPTGEPERLWRAGKELGFDTDAATAAEARQLATIGTSVRFRHPLVRSAVYYGAPLSERQRVHAALASATSLTRDPERRAWHQGAATSGPDELVAAVLVRAGNHIARRGAWSAAATFHARAAALSVDEAARAQRFLSAAEASCTAGAPGRAQALLDEAAAYQDDPNQRGLVQRVQGRIYHLLRQPAEATSAFLAAATNIGTIDIRLARDILVEAIVEAQINGRLAPGGTTRTDVARVAESLPLPPEALATPGDLVLDADSALQLHGLATAAPLLRQAMDAVRRDASGSPEMFQWLAAACADATILADDVGLHELARHMESRARDQGAVIPLALALSHAGGSELVAGLLSAAERCFIELAAIVEARGHDWSLGSLLVSAWRGQAKQTYALMDVVAQEAARQGQGYQLVFADYARCILDLGLGHYQQAYASVRAHTDDTSQLKFALADLVEAAHRSGEHRTAECQVERLAELAAISPTSRNLGYLARARAMVAADAPEAEGLYEEAIAQHARTRGPAHFARSQLVYGEWLRRAGRRRDARQHLHAAYGVFDEMGARAFANRARQELLATGEKLRPRTSAEVDSQLTAQEERVARLAAAGATNAEIAGQLYLSAFTVDYHLRKVFRKLGVASRRQLFHPQLDLV